MNEKEFQFRTAAFGGFQKQDVMAYLEQSAREHAEKLAQLHRELSEVTVAKAEGEEERASFVHRISDLEAENQRLSDELAEREATLAQITEQRNELEAMAAQLQELVDKLTPEAEAYEAVKDRTASIELEAHGRAQVIEREGREKARKCQEQVREWFEKTRDAYARLRTDMEATVTHAVQELERAEESMRSLPGTLAGQDAGLTAIQAQIQALDTPQPPQPLSLEDLEDDE